jgi:hypothetical protein
MVGKVKLTLFLSLAWWAVMNGQNLGSRNLPCPPFLWREIANPESVGEGAVPVLPPETVTAPTGQDAIRIGSRSLQTADVDFDSLELRLLDIEIEKAQARVSETSLWKRLIPEIHVSGSFGIHDVVFVDPTTFTPFILPRDAYRLTISLSLSGIFDFSKHSLAQLELERLSTERSLRLLSLAESRKILEQQLSALQQNLVIAQEEIRIIEDLVRFNQLRFEQGKIEFDTLMRTKLELLNARKAILRIQYQQSELQSKLSQGILQ